MEYYGYMVHIYHNDGYYSYYGDLNEEIFVKKGDLIDQETLIGTTYSNEDSGKLTFFIIASIFFIIYLCLYSIYKTTKGYYI